MTTPGGSTREQTRTPEPLQEPGSVTDPRSPRSLMASVARVGVSAAATIAARMVGLGVLGVVLGAVAFFIERATGVLAHPWEPWRYLVFGLLLVDMAAGAFCLGAAGMWRGIGRTAMNLVEEHKLTQHILGRVFDRAAVLAAGTATPEILRKPLPLQTLRDTLSRAVAAYSEDEDVEAGSRGLSRAILRRLKRWVCQKIEARLIELVGEESRDKGLAELTLDVIRLRAERELDGRVVDALNGARNKQALLFVAAFAGVLALPPIVLALLR